MPIRLYLLAILIAGSPGLGLEALLIGRGGKLTIDGKGGIHALKYAVPLGLTIAGVTAGIGSMFKLEPVFLFALAFALTFISGKLIAFESRKLENLPTPKSFSRDDIKSMLKRRGLGTLVKDEEENKLDD